MRSRASHRRRRRIRRLLPGCPRCSHPTLAPPRPALTRPSPTLVISLPIRIYLHTGNHLAKVGFQTTPRPHRFSPVPARTRPNPVPPSHRTNADPALPPPPPTLVIYLPIRIYLHTGTHLAKVGFWASSRPHQRWSTRSHQPAPTAPTGPTSTLVKSLPIRIYLHTGTHLAKVGFCLLEGMQCREQVWGGGSAARGCGAGTAALQQQTTEDRQQAANGKQQTAGRRRRVGGSTAAPRHDSTTTPPRKQPLGPAPESVTGPAGRKRDYYLAVKRGKA